MRIAYVEDNADNRLLVKALIGRTHEITEYEDGPSALAAMSAKLPEIVLLDISLPGMSGKDVLAAMKADPVLCTLPVIALTAHAMGGDREGFIAAGFDGYVAKPITSAHALTAEIDRIVPPRP